MNIAIDTHTNNFTFTAKIIKVPKANIDKDIMPILERGCDFNTLVNESGHSIPTLLEWFKEKMGITAAEYFKQKKLAALKEEFIELTKKGFSTRDIAKHYNRSYNWAYYNSLNFGIIQSRAERDANMNKSMYERIHNGDSVKKISEDLNCSYKKACDWVKKNLEDGIVRYRHDNNIVLNHKDNKKNTELKNTLAQIFAEGKSISEAGNILNMSSRMVYRYKKIFKLKTKLDAAHEFMDKYMPDMIKAGWGITKMANLIELSDSTISRKYRKLTGFTYKELHNII